MSQRLWILVILLATGLGGIGVGRLYFAPASASNPVLEAGTWLSPPRSLPAFDLIDQEGKPAGQERFAGSWTLVFFGFTHCPEACPTTLALLGTVRRELARTLPAANVPEVLLISVDPERDTPAVLKAYLTGFDPSFTGLTGNPEAVRAFATALGVPYRKIPMNGDYMLDHSTAIMLVGPGGQLAALFAGPHNADVLLRDVRSSVGTS